LTFKRSGIKFFPSRRSENGRNPTILHPISLNEIQDTIQHDLQEVRNRLREILVEDFPFVADIADHVVQMQGKLFRPTLLLLCGRLGGSGNENAALAPMALVVEMIHTATLIHDDTIDRASLRRGLETLNTRWNDQVSIIMGDYLYSRSLTEMVQVGDHDVLKVVSNASRRIALGEMKEIQLTALLDVTEEQYYSMIADKTASLLAASCEVGALLGPREYREELRHFGEHLGMAFQITDDLADYLGRERVMGKPVGNDLREKKVTLPLIHSIPVFGPERREELETFFSREAIDDQDVSTVTEMILDAGGFEYARKQAVAFGERAERAVIHLPESPVKDALLSCIAYIVER
jgi:octaprenyl-diphosphate synthase